MVYTLGTYKRRGSRGTKHPVRIQRSSFIHGIGKSLKKKSGFSIFFSFWHWPSTRQHAHCPPRPTAHGNSLDFEWAAANVSLAGNSFSVGFNERIVESLSDIWDLPAGLLFCNFSLESTINHNYVTTLVNGLYAGMASSSLLRANSGELRKITHNLGVRQGTKFVGFTLSR